jgi:hypothetical protein
MAWSALMFYEYAVLCEGEGVPRIPLLSKEDKGVLFPQTEKSRYPRRAKMRLDCTFDDARALFDGSYDHDLDQLSDMARCWLQQLQRKSSTEELNEAISSAIKIDEWIAVGPKCGTLSLQLLVVTMAATKLLQSLQSYPKPTWIAFLTRTRLTLL